MALHDPNYNIANPSAGDVYYDVAGTATTNNTQPSLNLGRVIHIGTASSGFRNVGFGLASQEQYGSQIATGTNVRRSVVGATSFATMAEGFYIIRRGGAQTEQIHGDSYTSLRSGASDGRRRSIHKVEILRSPLTATALRENHWNQVSGVWDAGYPQNDNGSGTWGIDQNAFVTDGTADNAALPSGEIPGELVYKEPKNTPVQDDYKERFLW